MKKFKRLLLIMCVAMMVFGSTLTVYASSLTDYPTADALAAVQSPDGQLVADIIAKYGLEAVEGHTTYLTKAEGDYVMFITYKNCIYGLDSTGPTAARDYAVARMRAIEKGASERQEIIGELEDITDANPDLKGAQKTFEGIMPGVNFVLGLIITLITVGMTILCALDIIYIVFPVFRGTCNNMKQEGKATSRKRSENAGEARLFFISDEAEFAVNTAETSQTGKSPLGIYFGKRLVSYIILAIVIFILLTGNLSIITNIALKAVSGLLSLIQDMAA